MLRTGRGGALRVKEGGGELVSLEEDLVAEARRVLGKCVLPSHGPSHMPWEMQKRVAWKGGGLRGRLI